MYLINKDETEHTGQVKHPPKESLNPYCQPPHCVCAGYTLTALCVGLYVCVCVSVCVFIRVCLNARSPTCGRCIRSDVGTSSQLETASASSTKTSSDREGTTGTPMLLGCVVRRTQCRWSAPQRGDPPHCGRRYSKAVGRFEEIHCKMDASELVFRQYQTYLGYLGVWCQSLNGGKKPLTFLDFSFGIPWF